MQKKYAVSTFGGSKGITNVEINKQIRRIVVPRLAINLTLR